MVMPQKRGAAETACRRNGLTQKRPAAETACRRNGLPQKRPAAEPPTYILLMR